MWMWQWLGGVVVQRVLVGSVWGKCLIDLGMQRLCAHCAFRVGSDPTLSPCFVCQRCGTLGELQKSGKGLALLKGWAVIPKLRAGLRESSSQEKLQRGSAVRVHHPAGMLLQTVGSDWAILGVLHWMSPWIQQSASQGSNSQLRTEGGWMLPRELQGLLCTWRPTRAQGMQRLVMLMLTSLCIGAFAISMHTWALQADGSSAMSQNSFINWCWYLVSWKKWAFKFIFKKS